jgi:NTE family protein
VVDISFFYIDSAMTRNPKILPFPFLMLLGYVTIASAGSIEIPLGLKADRSGASGSVPILCDQRPTIGFALSGGGARGLAHIGVLKVFERHGLPVDGIAGTSMGAIVGGLYAAGYTGRELDSITCHIDWNEIIRDAPPRRQLYLGQKEQKSRAVVQIRFEKFALDFQPAITAGRKLTSVLTDLLLRAPNPYTSDWSRLDIPLRVVTTDLLAGKKYVFDGGSLVDALRATLAIPLLFTPLDVDTMLLVDGGLLDNLPVEEARQSFKPDLLVAVDTCSKLRRRRSLNAPWEIADQVTTIMEQNSLASAKREADVVIEPDLADIANTDFEDVEKIIRAGEEAAERAIPVIDSLLARLDVLDRASGFPVRSCSVDGRILAPPAALEPMLEIPESGWMRQDEIAAAGRALYETGFFHSVRALLDTSSGALAFRVVENPLVRSIVLSGVSMAVDSVMAAALETKPGGLLNSYGLRRDANRLRDMYRRNGFPLARVTAVDTASGALVIRIDEGRLTGIRLHGNRRTKPFVIQRELPFGSRDLFNVSAFQQGIENLHSTGYFESIRFALNPSVGGHVLDLWFREQGSTLLRLGLRYDLERRTQTFLETVEENLFGAGAEGCVTGILGAKDRAIRASLRADQIFKTLLTARFSAGLTSQDYSFYESFTKTGRYRLDDLMTVFSIGEQMRRLGTLSFEIRNERIRLLPREGAKTPSEILSLWNLLLRSEVDTRDRLPFPRSGKYHIFEYETAAKFLGGERPYTRMWSSMESYYPVPGGIVLHPRIRWGTSDLTAPFAKQFRFGGIESFLGLPEESLVGRQFLILNGEARFRIPWPNWLESHIALRFDIGSAWAEVAQIQGKDFRRGLGVILSVQTPFGPIQAGLGKTNGLAERFCLSAGYHF